MAHMTNVQQRTHNNLARAEKTLIHAIVFEADSDKVKRLEQNVQRWTRAWKNCAPATVIHPALRPNVGVNQ